MPIEPAAEMFEAVPDRMAVSAAAPVVGAAAVHVRAAVAVCPVWVVRADGAAAAAADLAEVAAAADDGGNSYEYEYKNELDC